MYIIYIIGGIKIMATNFRFFLRLWVVANFLIFVYCLSGNTDNSVVSLFFWGYTLIVMVTELKSEQKAGFEELGASFLYGMLVSGIIIAFFSILALVFALILLGDWSFTFIIFKRLISLATFISVAFLVTDYFNQKN